MIIAHRRTIVARKPHQQNPSGIGRKNCACPPCHKDRTQLGCENPGKCILVAQMLLNSIHPKWNPTMDNHDLCCELALTEDEQHMNKKALQDDQAVVFDPDFALKNMNHGFHIFSTGESVNEIPARRRKI